MLMIMPEATSDYVEGVTVVDLNVAGELAAVEDATGVREPRAGGNSNCQGSLGGQVLNNGILNLFKVNSNVVYKLGCRALFLKRSPWIVPRL